MSYWAQKCSGNYFLSWECTSEDKRGVVPALMDRGTRSDTQVQGCEWWCVVRRGKGSVTGGVLASSSQELTLN